MEKDSIIIIGGGFAGLSAGIYAQMNGYESRIFEMHDQPGGLCTAWKRKGYTIDGCIHWLVGSSPLSNIHRFWQEVGVAQGREFVNAEEYLRHEASDGRTLIFYTDISRLERHLLEFSPVDEAPVREFIRGIRMCRAFDMPSGSVPFHDRVIRLVKFIGIIAMRGKEMRKWMKTSAEEFASRFKDPVLREAFVEMWLPEFSMFFMLVTFAYLHHKNAGYPIGGSLPMSLSMERRYIALGGKIGYNKKVKKILAEGDEAVGVMLEDGTVHRAERVISGADGFATIFKMLEGKFTDEKVRETYEKWPVFPPLLYIGIGVGRTFPEEPVTVSGFSFSLRQPVEIGGIVRSRLPVHIFSQDPTLAPAGKTVLVVMLESNYDYWKSLSKDRKNYRAEKEKASKAVIESLEQRFPGISGDVEMVDVATPVTFERYTGNWKGSFEGWLITPGNAGVFMRRMKQTLPGLRRFYMCGQWVEPGGGLPTSVMSARRLIRDICREDRRKFRTIA